MVATTESEGGSADAAPRRSLLQTLEIDARMVGMIAALLALAVAFDLVTDGRFLTPRNIFNLTIQTVSVAIMATGMVFIIVMRHIDLSVGSLLATCSAVMAMMQTVVLPDVVGLGLGDSMTAGITICIGVVVGALIGAAQGWMVGYLAIPAFIVTLGGYLVWRNVGWLITNGQTIGPLDPNFLLFGGTGGTLGEFWSWVVGVVAALSAVAIIWRSRANKARHGFDVKPVWAEAAYSALIVCAILGFIAILNAYEIPTRRLERAFEARGQVMPEGYSSGYGLPISVLVLIVIAVVMSVVAKRTRLGRYIFAAGGNPQAAELSGVDTRLLTMKIFAIMGALCAISAVVASARLANHGNDIGTLDELRVIAAAVIGGTALSGGVGTIAGAILGALIMQSLQSGMAMVGVDSPYQNVVVGMVLIVAVWIDIVYNKRMGGSA